VGIDRFYESMRGTLQNMIPNIGNMSSDYIFKNQEVDDPIRTHLRCIAPFSSSSYPIMYALEVDGSYEESEKEKNRSGTQEFDTDGPTEGVSYEVMLGVNLDFTKRLFNERPERKAKIMSLINEMKLGSRGWMTVLYMEEAYSIIDASKKIMDFVNRFESLIDNDNDYDDKEAEPWFPGDPSAEWDFEQEEERQLVRPPIQTNLNQQSY